MLLYFIIVSRIRPEIKWFNHEQVEYKLVTIIGGPNSCMWKNTGMICGSEWKANQT